MSGGVGPSGDILLKEEPKHDQQHQPLQTETQQKAHDRRGMFSFQQLNALAVAVVLSASGMVAVEDLAFVIFSFVYMYFLSKVAFPTLHPAHDQPVFDSRLLRMYAFVGGVVGLFLPVAYIFEGILEGDKEVLSMFGFKGPSGFSRFSTAEEVTHGLDGSGLTAIVTGASSGIGTETTRVLTLRGVHVVMAIRNMSAGREVKEAILKQNPTAKIDAMELDVSSIASVNKFVSGYKSSGFPLNILINNAGILATPYMLSKDNIELQFATNHVGHFHLTNLLLETMKRTARESSKEGRIVNVSSRRHQFSYPEGIRFDQINSQSWYNALSAYGQSKLANVLHANELARRLKDDGAKITANSVHPGAIPTNIFRHHSFFSGLANTFGKFVLKNVHQGAATTSYVALHPQVKGMSGKYFSNCNLEEASPQANDAQLAEKLWNFTANLIGENHS